MIWQSNAKVHMAALNVAFMYPLYESCKLNNLNFGKYLYDILTLMMKGDANYVAMLPVYLFMVFVLKAIRCYTGDINSGRATDFLK